MKLRRKKKKTYTENKCNPKKKPKHRAGGWKKGANTPKIVSANKNNIFNF